MWCFARKSDYGTKESHMSFFCYLKDDSNYLSKRMGGMSNQVFIASRKVIVIEFVFAFLLEILIAGPLSEKLAFRVVNPREDKPYVVTTAIICATNL